MLGFCQIVDASIVAPAVRGEDEGCDVIELSIRGCSLGIMGAIRLTTPRKIALAVTILMLHILLAPAPNTVENILLTKLNGNHHAIRHALCTGIVVLDIRNVAQSVAHLKVNLVWPTEHIVEHFFQFRVNIGLLVTHLHEEVTILVCFERALLPRGEGHCLDSQHHQGCQDQSFFHI